MAAGSVRIPGGARWVLPSADAEAVGKLAGELQLSTLAASVLAQRGIATPAAAREFLSPSITSLHDPNRIRDMEAAVERTFEAIRKNEAILLYGDYDVDGTTAIVLLKTGLDLLGARSEFHVPHRLREGYGMRSEVISEAAGRDVRLVISVDTGIRSGAVVEAARRLGIDVIVTDHHLPEAKLPPALAVLNPNRPDCEYPEKHLCGAAVAFKFLQALLERSTMKPAKREKLIDSFLKLVAIATVADIVPLTGENRVLVHRGLAGLRNARNPGLRALMDVAGLEKDVAPSAYQIAFRVAPRINAAGRLANAADVVRLFLTNDTEEAGRLAAQLDQLNRERQQTEQTIVEQILEQCESAVDLEQAALVFAEPGWHLGVVGIVASRLVERFCRPVFVLSEAAEEGFFAGSGRSVPSFHLLQALETMPDLFHKFGGHRQAAGLTIKREFVGEFQRRFHLIANERLSDEDRRPCHCADAQARFSELTPRAIAELLQLAPFGCGNPVPLLFSPAAEIAGEPRASANGRLLTVPLRQDDRVLFFKAWNFSHRAAELERGAKLDILFTVEDDPGSRARGYDGWSLAIKDVRTAA